MQPTTQQTAPAASPTWSNQSETTTNISTTDATAATPSPSVTGRRITWGTLPARSNPPATTINISTTEPFPLYPVRFPLRTDPPQLTREYLASALSLRFPAAKALALAERWDRADGARELFRCSEEGLCRIFFASGDASGGDGNKEEEEEEEMGRWLYAQIRRDKLRARVLRAQEEREWNERAAGLEEYARGLAGKEMTVLDGARVVTMKMCGVLSAREWERETERERGIGSWRSKSHEGTSWRIEDGREGAGCRGRSPSRGRSWTRRETRPAGSLLGELSMAVASVEVCDFSYVRKEVTREVGLLCRIWRWVVAWFGGGNDADDLEDVGNSWDGDEF